MKFSEQLNPKHPELQAKNNFDRLYWWKWLEKEKRELAIAEYGTQISVVGERSEFSSKVDNKSLAIMLAKMEADRYAKAYQLDFDRSTPFADWPEAVKHDIQHNREILKPYLAQMELENWNFEELAQAHIAAIVDSYGFDNRYCLFRLGTKEVIIERSIAIGAYLLKNLVEQRGWGKQIEALLVTSAVLPEDISVQIIEFAREMGIIDQSPRIELRDIRMACSSFSVALMMAAKDPLINSLEKVAVLSLDPLGDMMGLYTKAWSFDSPQLPVFSNGFVATGINPSEVTLAEGSYGMVRPDETRFIHYYQVLDDDPSLGHSLRRRIDDPNQLVSYYSMVPGHQVVAIRMSQPIAGDTPVESSYFDYTRPIVSTFPIIIKQFKESLGDEFDHSLLFSTRSHKRISELWRKLLLKHGHIDEPVDFDTSGNSSSAAMPGSMLQESPKSRWNSKNAKTFFAVSTGIGASIVVAAFILGKRKKAE